MSFFARPNLDNDQFKQLSGTTLTLCGQTQIATPTGLALSDGLGGYIPIIATGGTLGDVLTYNNGQIILQPGGGGGGVYSGASPTTCTVGGLVSGTPIYGQSISSILEEILVPTVYPILTPPSESSFGISPTDLTYEVGTTMNITVSAAFDYGSINPQFTSLSNCRSGPVTAYNYVAFGNTCAPISSALPVNTYVLNPHVTTNGNNTITSSISYAIGVQPKDSSGGNYNSPYPAGTTTPDAIIICGLLPYFWGSCVTLPVAGNALIASGTKEVADSNGDITINYNVNNKYIWLAVPATSTTKTKWYGSNAPSTNTEPIPGGLFNSPSTQSVNSPSSYWTGCNYKFYISNYQTSTIAGGTPYTITFTN